MNTSSTLWAELRSKSVSKRRGATKDTCRAKFETPRTISCAPANGHAQRADGRRSLLAHLLNVHPPPSPSATPRCRRASTHVRARARMYARAHAGSTYLLRGTEDISRRFGAEIIRGWPEDPMRGVGTRAGQPLARLSLRHMDADTYICVYISLSFAGNGRRATRCRGEVRPP